MSGSPQPTPTLVISDLPPKTLVGIDLFSFTSTPNFHGVKDLPAGAHFLYTGTTESFSLRSGEWFYIEGQGNGPSNQVSRAGGIDIRLRKWDTALETLVPVDESNDAGRQEAMGLRANLGAIWASGGLLAYTSRLNTIPENTTGASEEGRGLMSGKDERSPARGDWAKLSDHITPSVLSRILGPSNGTLGSSTQRWTISSGGSAWRDTDHIPGLSTKDIADAAGTAGEQEKDLQFLPVNLKKTWREGAIGRERTEAAQDRSWALGELIAHALPANQPRDAETAGEEQVLGELQFTFLMVLTLMNYSCMEQWKRLLGLIFTCQCAIKEREQFFVKVLQTLRIQLRHCDDVEGGLFEMDGEDGGTLLKNLLAKLKRTVDDMADASCVEFKKEFALLEQFVKAEYNWELSRASIVRRGLLELEDGEQVELEVKGAEEEDETK
ncbi:predicted protein [Uncinocarpus reesii 1704]|uniref:AAR2 family protein n=1 Tax=Uncinocarpus reesii (strain UAMH 1704) TaxID=336963 RepID=C4JIY7_UNCRE|nr:uncharacterized protein UREG_01594 [Uncinocarpus reesii 1704]EEP76745.1 predicted protein [Uncinocarpus reesii 1704]